MNQNEGSTLSERSLPFTSKIYLLNCNDGNGLLGQGQSANC